MRLERALEPIRQRHRPIATETLPGERYRADGSDGRYVQNRGQATLGMYEELPAVRGRAADTAVVRLRSDLRLHSQSQRLELSRRCLF